MLTTHNLRMLNPAVSQTPLCQEVGAEVPRTYISSKTIDLRKFVWVDGDTNFSPLELAQADELNLKFYNTGKLSPDFQRQTELVDPLLHNLYLYIDEPQYKGFCSVSPAPCCGLFHEIILREQETDGILLSKQQVEVKPERLVEHGSMITQHNGTVKSFFLPKFDVVENPNASKADKQYIVLEYEVENFNVATGMVGVGLPSVTVYGLFIANFLQKETLHMGDVGFAIGIHNMRTKHRIHGFLKAGAHTQNTLRKSNIQGYLVFDPVNAEQGQQIFERLHTNFKIAGCNLIHKRVFASDEIPDAYWMRQMDTEINEILQDDPESDALDVAFDFALDGRLSVPVASGFALFETPSYKPHMPHLKYPHTWVETLFKSTELVYGGFTKDFLYKRTYKNGVVAWEQA